MRSEDHQAQATAHQLVNCVLEADSDGLTETLETVVDQPADELRPYVREGVAELIGSPDDASFQLDLAVRGIDRRTGLDTVRRALTMTIGLLHWSEQPERLEAVMDP